MPKLNMIKAINLAMHNEMGRDDRVVVLGEDVGRVGGVFRATEGLFDKYGAKRVMDTPVAEAGIIGAAIGMAMYGLRPIAEIQFSGFAPNAYHQLYCHASRFRQRTMGRFTVPMVMRAPIGGGIRALEHHNDSEEALYVQAPGLKVVYPSSPRNAYGLLLAAIRDPDPVMYLEPKRVYRATQEEIDEDMKPMVIGQADVIKEGKNLTVISYGAMMHETKEAVAQAEKEFHIDIELIDLLSIVPLDTKTLVQSVWKTGRCVIVHEATRSCSVSSEIIARLNEEALLRLEAPIARVTGFDIIYPFFAREGAYLPSVPRIKAAIKQTIEF